MNQMPTAATTRAQRRAAWLNNSRLDWTRTPRMRRRLVLTMTLIMVLEAAGLLGLGAYAPGGDPMVALAGMAVLAALLVGFALCFGALKASTRGVEELEPEQLDERQMHLRGLVYAQAYKIGATLVIFLLTAAVIWSVVVGTYPPSLVITTVMVMTFQVAILLPTLVAAWHHQGADPEDV